jgi:hypothetical protein
MVPRLFLMALVVIAALYLLSSSRQSDGEQLTIIEENTVETPVGGGAPDCDTDWINASFVVTLGKASQLDQFHGILLGLRKVCVRTIVIGFLNEKAVLPTIRNFLARFAESRGIRVVLHALQSPGDAAFHRIRSELWMEDEEVSSTGVTGLGISLDMSCPQLRSEATNSALRQLEPMLQQWRGPGSTKNRTPMQCLWLLNSGMIAANAVWLRGCGRHIIGPLDNTLPHFWLPDAVQRQQRILQLDPSLVLLAGPSAAKGSEKRLSLASSCERLSRGDEERQLFVEKWGIKEEFRSTFGKWVEKTHLLKLGAFHLAHPYGVEGLRLDRPFDITDRRELLSAVMSASKGHSDDDFWSVAQWAAKAWLAEGTREPDPYFMHTRHIPVMEVRASHTTSDILGMLNVTVALGFAKLVVVCDAAQEQSRGMSLIRLFRLLSGLMGRVTIAVSSNAVASVTKKGTVVHVLPSNFEGPLMNATIKFCLAAIYHDTAASLGNEFCIVIRDPSAPVQTLGDMIPFAATVQHAVPFVFSLEPHSATVVSHRFFVVSPRANNVSLDLSLRKAEVVLLDSALRIRTTIMGYVVFDPSVKATATSPFSFLSEPISAVEQHIFQVKWGFNVSRYGGDPSGLDSVAVIDPPADPSPSLEYLACLAGGGWSTCPFSCPSCQSNPHVTSDLLTLARGADVFAPSTMLERLSRISAHLVDRLKLARHLAATGNRTIPVVPLWGSLIVPKDFGHWLNLMQENMEVGVGRYIVVLNRADERVHRFMTLLQRGVTEAVGSDWALTYFYRPENRGIADGWNLIGESSFDHPTRSVDWMIIMNNDISLRPGVLRSFAALTEKVKKVAVTNNLLGFASFAMTKFGWIHTGRFDANLWPAYATDVEYLSRIKSRGLVRSDFDAVQGDVVHAVSVTNLDYVFREWNRHWFRAEYIFRKWGMNIDALTDSVENYPVLRFNPYGVASMHHNDICVEPDHRQCIRTFTGVEYFGSRHCFFNISRLVEVCGANAADVPKWAAKRDVLYRGFAQPPPVDFDRLVAQKLFPLLSEGLYRRSRDRAQQGGRCFIPILVLVVFREADMLHDFLTRLSCSIGSIVLRTIGPGSRGRRIVTTLSLRLTELIDPRLEETVRSNMALQNNKRAFTTDRLDVALLDRLTVSVGTGFNDAVQAEVLDNVFGRMRNRTQSSADELDPPSIAGRTPPLDPCDVDSSNAWKRWALFVDVEQQLSDPAKLASLAEWMEHRTKGSAGCRQSVLSLVADNFFAVSISALRRVSNFSEPWGFADVSAAFGSVLSQGGDEVVLDYQFSGASTSSGYKSRSFEPFSEPNTAPVG